MHKFDVFDKLLGVGLALDFGILKLGPYLRLHLLQLLLELCSQHLIQCELVVYLR